MWKRKLYLVLSLICFCLQFVRLCRWNMISIIQIFYVFLQLKVWKIYMIRFLNINSTTNFLNNLVFNFFNYFFPVKMMWFSFKWWSLDFISLVTNMNWLIVIVVWTTYFFCFFSTFYTIQWSFDAHRVLFEYQAWARASRAFAQTSKPKHEHLQKYRAPSKRRASMCSDPSLLSSANPQMETL